MLIISDQTVAAFEAQRAAGMPTRFQAWWARHTDILGTQDTFRAPQIFQQYYPEFEFFGLEEEVQAFLFVAARSLMPEMDDRQLLETLDAIVLDAGDAERLAIIARVAKEGPGLA